MVTAVSSLLILEVHAFEVVAVLVLVLAEAMLQPVIKLALEEEFPVAVQFAIAVEHRILPLALVLEGLIEDEDAEA